MQKTIIGLVLVSLLICAHTARSARKVVYSQKQAIEIRKLLQEAYSPRADVALPAIAKLETYGEQARPKLISIVRSQIIRATALINSKIQRIVPVDELARLQTEWFDLSRAETPDAAALKKIDLTLARAFADRQAVIEAMENRARFMEILQRLVEQLPAQFGPEAEAALEAKIAKAVGGDLERVKNTHRWIAEARSENPTAAQAAIRSLDQLGIEARYPMVSLVRDLIQRDRRVLESKIAGLPKAAEIQALEKKLDARRKSARENIKRLKYAKEDEGKTTGQAKEHFNEMKEMWTKLSVSYGTRLQMSEAVARRESLGGLWEKLGPKAEQKLIDPKAESKLKADALGALGMTLDQAKSLTTSGKGPSDKSLQHLWFYVRCNSIAAHNARFAGMMHPEEYANVVAVNTYRKYLGLTPYDIDLRLVQSARRHSKEMTEKDYFSHTSPVAENKTYGKRTAKAGYRGASGENIASGYPSGEAAFWGWFSSPGHHRAMAGGHRQLGVGKWGSKFTQNYGRGRGPVGDSWAQVIKSQVIKGPVVEPQGS